MPIPVQIVGGFLGTGKTTFIREELARRPGERVAVIVNDFGEASLDEATLSEEAPFEITNIPGGCVCCTAPEGFVDALGAVLDTGPDRLLIEPTGLARPQDIIDTIRRCPHSDRLTLAPVVVLVDPARLEGGSDAEQTLVAQQLAIADVLVANRVDQASEPALERFRAIAAERWPAPLAVHETTHAKIPAELLAWPEGEGARLSRDGVTALPHGDPPTDHGHDHHDGHDHDHDHSHGDSTEGFASRSWRWSPERIFSRERLSRAVLRGQQGNAGAPLARFKGIFRTEEGVVRLQIAGGELHQERSEFRRDSRADAIVGSEDAAVLDTIEGWLDGALLSDHELEARTHQVEIAFPDGRVRIVARDDLAALPDGVADVSALFEKRAGAAARMASLWSELSLPDDGDAIVCAADGFASEAIPLRALREGVLLHSDADGAPLGAKSGGPFRLLIPDDVPDTPSSCANVKGVVRIVLRDDANG